MEMIMKLSEFLSYPFVRYALLAGILVALCSSLFGVTLVLKRFSFIGDGLSHVAFGAMAVATILNISGNMYFVLPVTVLCAVLILRRGESSALNGDAMIAMLSVGALAVGYLMMNIFSTSSNLSGDVCSALFGSSLILTLSVGEVVVSSALSLVVVAFFLGFYRHIFAITFDEEFSRACGVNVEKYNLIIAVMIAVIIVLAMNLVGSLLISALIVFPSLSAMCVVDNYRNVIIVSSLISVITTALGIICAILFSTPVGATVVAIEIIFYFAFKIAGGIRR